jgi:hypothetical protein
MGISLSPGLRAGPQLLKAPFGDDSESRVPDRYKYLISMFETAVT